MCLIYIFLPRLLQQMYCFSPPERYSTEELSKTHSTQVPHSARIPGPARTTRTTCTITLDLSPGSGDQSWPLQSSIIMLLCSVAKLCLTLWDPMDCSPPGFPVLHHLKLLSRSLLKLMSIVSVMPSISSSVTLIVWWFKEHVRTSFQLNKEQCSLKSNKMNCPLNMGRVSKIFHTPNERQVSFLQRHSLEKRVRISIWTSPKPPVSLGISSVTAKDVGCSSPGRLVRKGAIASDSITSCVWGAVGGRRGRAQTAKSLQSGNPSCLHIFQVEPRADLSRSEFQIKCWTSNDVDPSGDSVLW